ncbi:hypothetical protein KPH14_007564 [Odynerus spinipes]|uniref:Uncharacterized protein n=1 Tax=Odynerus spinipes TaxID=1348599 RepID=A0AAD9RHR8_9HYME|nr:hypothetical protein KPH14_007564 [Odynerus spinipes]
MKYRIVKYLRIVLVTILVTFTEVYVRNSRYRQINFTFYSGKLSEVPLLSIDEQRRIAFNGVNVSDVKPTAAAAVGAAAAAAAAAQMRATAHYRNRFYWLLRVKLYEEPVLRGKGNDVKKNRGGRMREKEAKEKKEKKEEEEEEEEEEEMLCKLSSDAAKPRTLIIRWEWHEDFQLAIESSPGNSPNLAVPSFRKSKKIELYAFRSYPTPVVVLTI